MPWTIWRYTVIEAGRLTILCAAVLVGVIAFAATVKPLAEGQLDVISAARFMFLAVPPMLAYAAPFAGGFGATLAYHRMAQDNEVIAARAGGVSTRRLLVPAATVGLMLALSLTALNEQVIPRFLRQMETMIRQDLARAVVRSLQTGEAASIGGFTLHADDARPASYDGLGETETAFLLSGVVAIQRDREGRVLTDATATRAWLILDNQPTGASMSLIVENAAGRNRGSMFRTEQFRWSPGVIPGTFNNDPKFLTSGELTAAMDDPSNLGDVSKRREELANLLALRSAGAIVKDRLQTVGRLTLRDRLGRGVTFIGSDLIDNGNGWTIRPRPGDRGVLVELDDAGLAGFETLLAQDAKLRIDSNALSGFADAGLRLALELSNVGPVVDATSPGAMTDPLGRVELRTIGGLRLDPDPGVRMLDASAEALIERVDEIEAATPGGVGGLGESRDRLRTEVRDARREITSKRHERMAMAASCFVMVLIGAVMGMTLRDKSTLVVYLWAFFPALASLQTVAAGQRVTHDEGVVGLVLLWGGVVVLATYTLIAERKLAKR